MEHLNLKSTIESIIEDLSNNRDIREFALKIQMVANKLKNPEFSVWVKNELEGYGDVKNLPPHRLLSTHILATVAVSQGFGGIMTMKNHRMPLSTLGDTDVIKMLTTVRVVDSVIALEERTKIEIKKNSTFGCALNEWEILQISKIYENSVINSAHKVIDITDFKNIIYKFKSTLLEIFMEFDEKIFNDELNFDVMTKRQEIKKVVNQTINAGQCFNNSSVILNDSPITMGDNNTVSISNQRKEELKGIIDKIETLSKNIESDREDIATEVAKIRLELDNTIQRPKVLRSAFNSLKGISTGIAANFLTPIIDEALSKLQ